MAATRFLPIVLILSSAVSFARRPAPGQASNDVAGGLNEIAQRFCSALARKDMDGLVALWSRTSPSLADFKQQIQQLFSAYDKIDIKNAILSNVAVQADHATARLGFDMDAIETRTGKPASGLARQIETLAFVKEGDAFRIHSYRPAAADLAAALIAAKTEQERTALLEGDPELLVVELRRQLISLGNRLRLKGDYAQAISAYDIAQSVAEQIRDREGVAWALAYKGVVHVGRADYGLARDVLERSLKLHEALGNQSGVLFSLKYIGDVHRFLDHQKEAFEVYQKCLDLAAASGNRLVRAYVLGAIGGLYAQQSEFSQALHYYQESLALHEALGDKGSIAGALASMGYINGATGNQDSARDLLQKSLSLFESLGDKAGAAYALVNLGATCSAAGDFARALEYYERGLAINESLGNKSGIATGLNNIGIIYRMQGNYPQALEYLERSLKMNQDIAARIGVARVLNSIGNVHSMLRDHTGAQDYYNRSMAIYEELSDRAGIATELDNIGTALAWRADYAGALEYLKRSLSVTEANGFTGGLARSLGHVAFIYSAQGNHSEALKAADRATALALEVGQVETAMDSRVTAGRAYLTLQQPTQARTAFDEAIKIVEDIRSRVAGPEQELQRFFEGNLYPYQAIVALLIEQGDVAGALSYAERGKGRVLLDVLRSGRVNINKAMTLEEREHERGLAAEIVSLNNQIYSEQQRPQPDAARIGGLNARVQKARLDHEDFQTTLYALHPELRVKRGEAGPINLDEAGSLVADGKTALLEYVVTTDRIYLFALTRSHQPSAHPIDLTIHTIDIGEKEVSRQVERFRETLANQNYAFQKPALELYRMLLEPVQAQLNGQSSLVIVPDGVLWTLPFQALVQKQGRFLIEDHAVSYAPSLTVLSQMRLIHKSAATSAPTALLAVGNPTPGNPGPGRARTTQTDRHFEPLPEAEEQVRSLAQLYGTQRSKVLVGVDAREEVIKAESSKYKIVHLATHGVLDDASPMYSYLLLSRPGGSATEDGLLEAWEIMDLNLRADLVVLSACETARGKIGAGEGVIGLSWAVFVAGCPTSVVSQWNVESASTTELMVRFHQNLTGARSPAEDERGTRADDSTTRLSKAQALRQAQLSLLHSKNYKHPFYWAAFVLMGDGSRPIPQ